MNHQVWPSESSRKIKFRIFSSCKVLLTDQSAFSWLVRSGTSLYLGRIRLIDQPIPIYMYDFFLKNYKFKFMPTLNQLKNKMIWVSDWDKCFPLKSKQKHFTVNWVNNTKSHHQIHSYHLFLRFKPYNPSIIKFLFFIF